MSNPPDTAQKVWRPFPKQERFLALPDSIFEALYGGAAGGGKSETLLMLPLVRGFFNNPHFKGIILRRTFPELESELIVRSREYYPASGGEYNEQKKRYRWPSGAIVQFGHAEAEQDIRKYDTVEYNYIGFDELTSFTEFQYIYLSATRCRSAHPDLPAIVRSGTNPGNVGHGWVKERFITPHPEGSVIIRDKRTQQLRIFIPARLQDNPRLREYDPNYEFRLQMLPEAEKRAKLYGDWDTFEGQVFEDWRLEPLPGEPANARHICAPFEIPSYWPRVLAIDWGFTAMLWAGWAAVSPERRAYIYREYAAKKEKISTWASNIARLSSKETLDDIVMCPSAWQNRGDEKNIAQQFEEHSGLTPRPADADRIGGKMLIQEYLRWQPRPQRFIPPGGFDSETSQKILRLYGLQAYKEYCTSFQPESPETNLPKLQVLPCCTELIRAIPRCLYDETNKEDIKEFPGDDPIDGLRYLLKAVESLGEGPGFEKREEIGKVEERFVVDKDINAYYMRMRVLEAKLKNANVPIRRFHRAQRENSQMATR